MDLGHNHAVYSAIDAGISTRQPAKFCDLVGFEGRYTDPKSGIRYYSKDQYQAITEMPQTVKDEILSVRKANIVLRWLKMSLAVERLWYWIKWVSNVRLY